MTVPLRKRFDEFSPEPLASSIQAFADSAQSALRAQFRPDIHALRAFAVTCVVLYHAGIQMFSGGYIGVDIFFVISGYLITGSLVQEVEKKGRIDFLAFYARRIRRLLPAATLVMLSATFTAMLLMSPLEQREIVSSLLYTSLYASNLFFASQATDYLAGGLEANPLLHTWSLSVEEQFYLLWPLIVLIGMQGASSYSRMSHSRNRLAIFIAGLSALSFGASLWCMTISQPWAFFSSPLRAWEFAVGGLAFLLNPTHFSSTHINPIHSKKQFQHEQTSLVRSAFNNTAIVLGFALTAYACVMYDRTTVFPGVSATIPVLGAFLIVLCGAQSKLHRSLLLNNRVVKLVGDLSYSWYLWHWPLLVFAELYNPELDTPDKLALMVLALALSWITYHFVENKIRFNPHFVSGSGRSLRLGAILTSAGLGGTALLFLLSHSVYNSSYDVGRYDAESLETSDRDISKRDIDNRDTGDRKTVSDSSTIQSGAKDSGHHLPQSYNASLSQDVIARARMNIPKVYKDNCHLPFSKTVSPECIYGNRGSSKTAVLFGDSHAAQWFPALEQMALSDNWRIVSLTKSACPSVVISLNNKALGRRYTECEQWRSSALARIKSETPSLIVISNSHQYFKDGALGINQSPITHSQWLEGLTSLLKDVSGTGARIVIIGNSPVPGFDVPKCLSKALARGDSPSVCDFKLAKSLTSSIFTLETEAIAALQKESSIFRNITTLETSHILCKGDTCHSSLQDAIYYRDKEHLTTDIATSLAPALLLKTRELH